MISCKIEWSLFQVYNTKHAQVIIFIINFITKPLKWLLGLKGLTGFICIPIICILVTNILITLEYHGYFRLKFLKLECTFSKTLMPPHLHN